MCALIWTLNGSPNGVRKQLAKIIFDLFWIHNWTSNQQTPWLTVYLVLDRVVGSTISFLARKHRKTSVERQQLGTPTRTLAAPAACGVTLFWPFLCRRLGGAGALSPVDALVGMHARRAPCALGGLGPSP